jgi:hypothetical protein
MPRNHTDDSETLDPWDKMRICEPAFPQVEACWHSGSDQPVPEGPICWHPAWFTNGVPKAWVYDALRLLFV